MFHRVKMKGLAIIIKKNVKVTGGFHLKKPLVGNRGLAFQVAEHGTDIVLKNDVAVLLCALF